MVHMSKAEITKAMKSTPFRPFTVRLADDSQIQILSADHAHVSPSGRTLVVSEDDGTRLIDTALILEMKTTEAA
jgi:hypothetical protein